VSPLLGSALDLRCQLLTAPLAVRRPWPGLVDGPDSWWMRRSPPPSPSGATWAARAVQGLSFLTSFLAPVAGAAIRAPGGLQPPSSSSAPELHCHIVIVPWPTEDQGPAHRCQRLTAPLAARRPWASLAGGSLTLVCVWEVRRSCRPEGDRGGGNSPGPLLPEVLPGPRRRSGDHGLPVDVSLSFCLGSRCTVTI
jgi:hypothetical protein